MEKADALLYLNLDDGQDIEEAYENQIFSFKQFFLPNVPTSKAFNAKRNRLEKMHEAYIFFGGVEFAEDCDKPELIAFDSTNIALTFRTFQENNNRIKLRISSSKNAKCLSQYAQLLIENMSNYAKLWDVNLDSTSEKVFITKAPDAVELLNAINAINKQGFIYFDEIQKLDPQNSVYRESIRLSLWLKMENNE